MKKKLSIITAICLSVALLFAGCAGGYFNKKVKEVPDQSYAVVGNGNMSVQQGRYIYFINGYNDITDSDGKTNKWGNVVKGGIYRVDMTGGKDVVLTADFNKAVNDSGYAADEYMGYYGGDYKTVVAANIPSVKEDKADDYSGFDMVEKKTYEDEAYSAVEATAIVPKKVSNGKTENGGIYIFENWIYYCSPVEKRNKKGEVQFNLVAFMRTRLDGTKTEVVYETTDPDASLNYGYYRYQNKTYLTVLEGTTLYSVTCKDGGGTSTHYKLAEDVVSALFSNKPIYYSGMREDTIEDYIYYTKKATADDVNPNGAVLYRVHPDNTDGLSLMNNGHDVTLQEVKNGYLYYMLTDSSNERKMYANNLAAYATDSTVSNDVVNFGVISGFSQLYFHSSVNRYDASTKEVEVSHAVLWAYNGQTDMLTINSQGEVTAQTINAAESMSVIGVEGDVIYYFTDNRTDTEQNSTLEVVVEKMSLIDGLPVIITQKKAVIGNFVKPDVSAGYLFFAATEISVPTAEDKNTSEARVVSGYACLRRVDGLGDKEASTDVTDQLSEPEWAIEAFAPDDAKTVEKTEEEKTTT